MNDTFPYRNKLYSDEHKINIFKNLKQYRLKLEKQNDLPNTNIKLPKACFLYRGESYRLVFSKEDYYNVLILSDLFVDECRSKCKFSRFMSPYDFYYRNKKILVDYIKKNNLELNDINMRDAIYYNIGFECSTHNPGILKFFIEKYKARKILDMSSGWGDRLAACLASDIDIYTGIDPNKCLHSHYKEMIDLLSPYAVNPNATYDMINTSFEKYDCKEINYYDVVYTSPPYFNYEDYTGSDSQTYKIYNNEDLWLDNFIKVSIIKSIKALKYGGHLILYFSQEKGKSYMEKFFYWIKTIDELFFMGCIFFSNKNKINKNKINKINVLPHPIFIFYKSKKVPSILYNPKPVIKSIELNSVNINVIREDYVIGGTKTRASLQFFRALFKKNKNINQLIYLGAANGYAQLAIPYCLYLLKKSDVKLVFVLQNINNYDIFNLRKLSKWYHPNTTFIIKNLKMKELYPIVDAYNGPNDYIIPFGFSFNIYKNIIYKKLFKYIEPLKTKIRRMWVIIGSGTVLYTLQKLLPNTLFFGVQVGRDVKPEEIYDNKRLTLYRSSYKLYEKYEGNIPYTTEATYDAKVLEFVEKYGKPDDYIWNVSGLRTK